MYLGHFKLKLQYFRKKISGWSSILLILKIIKKQILAIKINIIFFFVFCPPIIVLWFMHSINYLITLNLFTILSCTYIYIQAKNFLKIFLKVILILITICYAKAGLLLGVWLDDWGSSIGAVDLAAISLTLLFKLLIE